MNDDFQNMVRAQKSGDIEETMKKLMANPGVVGLIILNKDGIAIRTTLDRKKTQEYAALFTRFKDNVRKSVTELDPTNDLQFIRIRSKKNEVLIAPERDYSMLVIQTPSRSQNPESAI